MCLQILIWYLSDSKLRLSRDEIPSFHSLRTTLAKKCNRIKLVHIIVSVHQYHP